MPATEKERREFLRQYLVTMFWSETDNTDDSGGEPLDANYDEGDLTETARARAQKDCNAFIDKASDMIDQMGGCDGSNYELAGHCFWLNRNGHGTGFWDREEVPEDLREKLSDLAHTFGECDAYVTDDGEIDFF